MGNYERRARRRQSRFEMWALGEVIVLRIALVGTYLLYIYAGVIAFIAGVPVFDLTTPRGYTAIWAALLTTSAFLAAIGAVHARWERLEKWSALILTSFAMTYVLSLNIVGWVDGDLRRQFIGAIAAIAVLLPVTRFAYLAAQTGKRRVHVADGR